MKKRDIRKLLRRELSSPTTAQSLAFDLSRVQPVLVKMEIARLERKKRRLQLYAMLSIGYFFFLLTLQILILLDGQQTLIPLFLTLPLVVAMASWMRQVDRDLLIFRILGNLPETEAQEPRSASLAEPLQIVEIPDAGADAADDTLLLPEMDPSLPQRTLPLPRQAITGMSERAWPTQPQTSVPV